jgi:hypothetical protein
MPAAAAVGSSLFGVMPRAARLRLVALQERLIDEYLAPERGACVSARAISGVARREETLCRVAAALAFSCDEFGRAHISVRALAAKVAKRERVSPRATKRTLCRRTIFAALRELEQAGVVQRIRDFRPHNGPQKCSIYALALPRAEAVPPLSSAPIPNDPKEASPVKYLDMQPEGAPSISDLIRESCPSITPNVLAELEESFVSVPNARALVGEIIARGASQGRSVAWIIGALRAEAANPSPTPLSARPFCRSEAEEVALSECLTRGTPLAPEFAHLACPSQEMSVPTLRTGPSEDERLALFERLTGGVAS